MSGAGEGAAELFNGTGFPFSKMKRVLWMDDGDGTQ